MNADLLSVIRGAAQMGAAEAIRRMQPDKDRISKRRAVAEFGSGFLKANADRLTVVPNGNRLEYSRAELQQLKASLSVAALAVRIENNLTTK